MAYVRTIWKARAGNGLERFIKVNETSSEVYLINEPVSLTEPGTNFSSANMNKIEQGLIDAHQMLDDQYEEKVSYNELFPHTK